MVQLWLSQEHYDKLLSAFQAKDIGDLRLKLELGETPQSPQTQEEIMTARKNEKMQQEILNLKLKNQLYLVHDLKISPEIAIKIAKGELDLIDALSPKVAKQEGLAIPQKDNETWMHFCTAVKRVVEYDVKIDYCKWCGDSKEYLTRLVQ